MRHGHLCRRFSTRRSPAVRATVAAAPSLREFLTPTTDGAAASAAAPDDASPYVDASLLRGDGRTVHVETYGCQMNVSDSEVVAAVLRDAGYGRSASAADADVVLLNTCAIREGAESKIWQRLRELRARGRERRAARSGRPPLVGVLGCMGERLKGKLLESPTAHDRLADLVCGPDAYRSLPRLLAEAGSGQPALDVALSLEETYAEIAPVREGSDGVSAFVSIMRGCNNMCSYCIVPHTRGRERSRDATSIAAEVAALADAGYREVTLLGQNVNSYADSSSGTDGAADSAAYAEAQRAAGFNPMVPPPTASLRFGGLLEMLADAHPEVRFRFTSPHPKDFPDEVLDAIATRPNLCESLHIPAQVPCAAPPARPRLRRPPASPTARLAHPDAVPSRTHPGAVRLDVRPPVHAPRLLARGLPRSRGARARAAAERRDLVRLHLGVLRRERGGPSRDALLMEEVCEMQSTARLGRTALAWPSLHHPPLARPKRCGTKRRSCSRTRCERRPTPTAN